MQISNSRRGAAPATYVAAAMLAFVLSACSENAPAASDSASSDPAPSALAASAPAETAPATTGDAVYRGAAISRQVCAQCHDIGDGSKPAIHSPSPTFKAVAERPETTSDGLTRWLQSSHPSMPHYVFPESEVADIVAYIMSLRPAAPT